MFYSSNPADENCLCFTPNFELVLPRPQAEAAVKQFVETHTSGIIVVEGPPGIGKTELARRWAGLYGKDPEAYIFSRGSEKRRGLPSLQRLAGEVQGTLVNYNPSRPPACLDLQSKEYSAQACLQIVRQGIAAFKSRLAFGEFGAIVIDEADAIAPDSLLRSSLLGLEVDLPDRVFCFLTARDRHLGGELASTGVNVLRVRPDEGVDLSLWAEALKPWTQKLVEQILKLVQKALDGRSPDVLNYWNTFDWNKLTDGIVDAAAYFSEGNVWMLEDALESLWKDFCAVVDLSLQANFCLATCDLTAIRFVERLPFSWGLNWSEIHKSPLEFRLTSLRAEILDALSELPAIRSSNWHPELLARQVLYLFSNFGSRDPFDLQDFQESRIGVHESLNCDWDALHVESLNCLMPYLRWPYENPKSRERFCQFFHPTFATLCFEAELALRRQTLTIN